MSSKGTRVIRLVVLLVMVLTGIISVCNADDNMAEHVTKGSVVLSKHPSNTWEGIYFIEVEYLETKTVVKLSTGKEMYLKYHVGDTIK